MVGTEFSKAETLEKFYPDHHHSRFIKEHYPAPDIPVALIPLHDRIFSGKSEV
jgi:hypothetical protein